ncbi:glycoside hydrolase family 9 protein [Fretibacter rubidus]|uniref:glycoside hydrolase family 9 protein n=1 Tax=Fretibacter rubidus TaxID=570162 RepID=UPI00352B8EA2
MKQRLRFALIWAVTRAMAVGIIVSAGGLFAHAKPPLTPLPTRIIVVDQFGYLPELEKRAVIRFPVIGWDRLPIGHDRKPIENLGSLYTQDTSTKPSVYGVLNVNTNAFVYQGVSKPWKGGAIDAASGDKLAIFDFSAVTTPGTYRIVNLDDGYEDFTNQSHPFEIRDDIYTPVLKAAFKTFFYQRAGFAKDAPYAAVGYRDGASHIGPGQDGQARLYSAKDDASTERDLRGGWYDAGDYNKYTSWTSNYVRWMLHSYLENPAVWTDDFNIPESGNGTPDILDEVKWGLDWLERMQNPDGSMLSVMGLSEASPPSAATGPSFYGPENTSSAYSAAGAFAMASTVMAQSHPAAAARYKTRAKDAWDWAVANPDVTFFNNNGAQGSKGLAAGQQEVGPDRLSKKIMMSAVYMYEMTGEAKYADQVQALYTQIKPMRPTAADGFEGDIAPTLLYFARLDGIDADFRGAILRDYKAAVVGSGEVLTPMLDGRDGYGSYMPNYFWGSNGTKSRRGSIFTQAIISGIGGATDAQYRNVASHYLHYLHGVNPLGKVYLSNMGTLGAETSVSEFYHAWFKDGHADYDSTLTSTYGPAPGFLVGGPNPSYARDDCCMTQCGDYGDDMCKLPEMRPPAGQPPAKSYTDFNEGWPLNSWSVTENSNAYQLSYIRLLSKFAK